MQQLTSEAPTKEDVQVRFGNRIRVLREGKQFTQERLAEGSGMHTTYISQIERGLKNVSLFNIYRLASALGVPAGDLLSAPDTPLSA